MNLYNFQFFRDQHSPRLSRKWGHNGAYAVADYREMGTHIEPGRGSDCRGTFVTSHATFDPK